MMNLGAYWHIKPLRLLAEQVLPWRGFYRPMAGLFYVPLFRVFGLNPVPFHAVIFVFLLASTVLTYRLARLLGCGEPASGVAAFAVAYHPGLANLTYNVAFVYDVLCGFFYLAALTVYMGARAGGAVPSRRRVAAFLALFQCALNSKEMAVTLPAMLLLYEWLYRRPRSFRLAGLALALDAVYLYGRFRPHALASQSGYRPEFTWERFAEFQVRSFADLTATWNYFTGAGIAALWVLLLYLAWRRPRPELRFCSLFLAIAPLPIEFLSGREGACLFLPWVAGAIFASSVLVSAVERVAAFLAAEPIFRYLGRRAAFVLLIAACLFLWARRNDDIRRTAVEPAMAQTGALTWEVLQQLRSIAPRVRPHSSVVFLNDPFPQFDMAFIADLWFRDPSVQVKLNAKTPLAPEELAAADYVFDYRDGRLIRLSPVD
jgi:hypothetical protein